VFAIVDGLVRIVVALRSTGGDKAWLLHALEGVIGIGLGIAIALALVLPAAIGVGIDALSHSSPVGFLIGLAVGIVAACATAFMQFRRYL